MRAYRVPIQVYGSAGQQVWVLRQAVQHGRAEPELDGGDERLDRLLLLHLAGQGAVRDGEVARQPIHGPPADAWCAGLLLRATHVQQVGVVVDIVIW